MAGINGIDYSVWTNKNAASIAAEVDTDGQKGLQGIEIFNFENKAVESNMNKNEVFGLLGLSLSSEPSNIRKAKRTAPTQRETNPEFNAAADYYNSTKAKSNYRSEITYNTQRNTITRLHNMEQSIDQAFIACDAYQDILIVPRRYYRYYPGIDTRLVNFDIEELRNTTDKDMKALHELKDKIEYIIEEANGITEHKEPERTEFDIEALAVKHLGMSYEDFEKEYHDELEFCKTVTYANYATMTERQAFVYSKARAYAADIVNKTVTEAHNVNWDARERILDETFNTSSDQSTISSFEKNGITEDGLNQIQSGITYKAFEEALIGKYNEVLSTGTEDKMADAANANPVKAFIDGKWQIIKNGQKYDTAGRKIK